MNHNRVLLVTAIISLIFTSCSPFQTKDTTITIITTNDIHSSLDNFPQLKALIDSKEAESDEVLVIDAGDRFTGNPYVDYAKERGEPIINIMNEVGYDLGCLGNHEFDYGQDVLKKRVAEADFPMICANINTESSNLGTFEPYHIDTINGLKLCFLGLLQVEGKSKIPSSSPLNLKNLSFSHFSSEVPKYKHLADENDFFIALSHLGYESDSTLAELMPELDLIIGGHSHTRLDEEVYYNDVLITQTGGNLRNAGVITIKFKGKKLENIAYELIDLSTIVEKDAEIEKMVKEALSQSSFEESVGVASEDIKGSENVASVLNDAMILATGSDIAFYNKGGVRSSSIPKGDISLKQVLEIEPFGNEIVTFDLTLQEIEAFILRSYSSRKQLNFFISPGKYEIIDRGNNPAEVKIYDKGGKLLSESNKKYKIAISDYVAISDPMLKDGTPSGYLIATSVVDYLVAP